MCNWLVVEKAKVERGGLSIEKDLPRVCLVRSSWSIL